MRKDKKRGERGKTIGVTCFERKLGTQAGKFLDNTWAPRGVRDKKGGGGDFWAREKNQAVQKPKVESCINEGPKCEREKKAN